MSAKEESLPYGSESNNFVSRSSTPLYSCLVWLSLKKYSANPVKSPSPDPPDTVGCRTTQILNPKCVLCVLPSKKFQHTPSNQTLRTPLTQWGVGQPKYWIQSVCVRERVCCVCCECVCVSVFVWVCVRAAMSASESNLQTARKENTIISPTVINYSLPSSETNVKLEYSLHTHPRGFKREYDYIFQDAYSDGIEPNSSSHSANTHFALPVSLYSSLDLCSMGPDIAAEKDRLLEVFQILAVQIQGTLSTLHKSEFWIDYIDPCSGLPCLSPSLLTSQRFFSEVQSFSTLLGYKQQDAGGCKVLLHPKWGTHFYPATIVLWGRDDIVRAALAEVFSNNWKNVNE